MPKRSRSSSIRRRSATASFWSCFFQIHDPTTRNRQGNDIGTSYRSAIFYTTDEQKRIAEDTIADVDASGLWPGKVVTEVAPAGDFWQAEPEHQDYLERYPDGYTCHFVRPLNPSSPVRAKAPIYGVSVKAILKRFLRKTARLGRQQLQAPKLAWPLRPITRWSWTVMPSVPHRPPP